MDTQRLHESNIESEAGKINFSEFVSILEEMEVEYCRIDLLEARMTFVTKSGDYFKDQLDLISRQVAEKFDDGGIRQAIHDSQKGRYGYKEFCHELMKSGVATYTILPEGRKTIYFGRSGDCYYDNFKSEPGGAPPQGPETSTVQ